MIDTERSRTKSASAQRGVTSRKKSRSSRPHALEVLALYCLGCSALPATSEQSTRVLDDRGGTLHLGQVATLVVAAGAVSTTFTVRAELTPPPHAPEAPMVSEVLLLTPHGTRFTIPARVSLRYQSQAPTSSLRVLRLADAEDTTWEPVGGVRFAAGVATFDTPGFSYYVVTEGGQCELVETPPPACEGSCECCGSAVCVSVATDVANCGGCGIACDAQSFCSSASTCVTASPRALCANRQLYVVQGQLPDLTVTNPEQTTDGLYAAQLASQIAAFCPGLNVMTISQAADGLLDPCTDAPLVGGGVTLLVTGGSFAQRVAGYLDQAAAPLSMEVSAEGAQYTFRSRQGATLVSFPRDALSDTHDYFVLAFLRDPERGAQVFQVYGVGWEGTPAATWYFERRLLPALAAGTASWSRYVLIEWTDDGDGVKGEADTFTVLAQDVP